MPVRVCAYGDERHVFEKDIREIEREFEKDTERDRERTRFMLA